VSSEVAPRGDYFAARGEAVAWRTRGHDEPADLPIRLQAAGWVPEEQSTVLIGLTAEIAASPVVPEGVVLRAVTADADMRRIAGMESAAWGRELPGLADDLIGRIAAAPDDIAVLAAEADGDVVSAAWLVFRPGTDFASLWGGTTLPRWRGRGIYRALVAAPRAACRRTRRQVPAGRRLRGQRPHPAPPGLPRRHHHHPIRMDTAAARSCQMNLAASERPPGPHHGQAQHRRQRTPRPAAHTK
jgi:GNAT superfamily N-acetyltransferase